MKQRLRGRKIFGFPITGSIATMRAPSAGTILVARTLTPSVVRALRDNHVAVITSRGGFACHGANVLRVVKRSESRHFTWVTELPDEITLLPPGTLCEVLTDGTVVVTLSETINLQGKEYVGELVGLLSSGTLIRCYWPDRVYDKFSASIMLPGLSDDMKELGFNGSAIHGPDQLIWFQGAAPTSEELLEDAQFSSDLCKRTMGRQRNTYSSILLKLRALDCSGGNLDDLVDICRAYFSCFLLHHRTYSEVLSRALLTEESLAQPDGAGMAIVERLLCTELVQWYTMLPSPISLRKDFVEEQLIIPLPPFTPEQEISLAEDRVAVLVERHGLPHSTFETLCNIARLCILKEWKFILIKIITSRLAERLRSLPIGASAIRNLTIEGILKGYCAPEET